jgi:hypothetical protein
MWRATGRTSTHGAVNDVPEELHEPRRTAHESCKKGSRRSAAIEEAVYDVYDVLEGLQEMLMRTAL